MSSSSNNLYLSLLLSLIFLFTYAASQPATLSFNDCSSGDALDPSQRINVSTVYGQIVTDNNLGKHLNLTVIGDTGEEIIPMSNTTGLLATLFTTSSILTFSVWDNSTFFCSTLRPPSPLPALDPNSTSFYCPLAAGPLAFSATVPFKDHNFELFTLHTQLRVVDTSQPAVELACVDIAATPLVEGPVGSIYGHAAIIFWASVSLAIAYWVVVGLGRIAAAWGRGGSRNGHGLWSRLESAGFILASAISGERLAVTPALMRFGTPSMRDIIFHTQWCAALAMVAVQWPLFVYPFLAQTAWSTLSYNITLTQGANAAEEHWNPLSVQTYNPPSDFADQLSDPTSPIYIDSNAANTLLMLPQSATSGMESFAAAVGLRPQDLFGVCLGLFLSIVAVTVVISLFIWGFDRLVSSILGRGEREANFGTRSPPYNAGSKDMVDKSGLSVPEEDSQATSGHFLFRASSIPLGSAFGRSWWRHRIRPNSFHGSVLHGNLVRILILFHLPITIFSCYQFTGGRSHTTLGAVILAALSFAAFSLAFPMWLILRLTRTATNKLYDETRTLLMLGPLYNHYGHGSQLFACLLFATNLVFGITIGCGQKSGTAQAIIILVVEVASALGTSIWLPWGQGASMGLISFFFCVARIIVAVLLVILTPVVSVGDAAAGWVACAILFILGLIYLGFILILFIKLIEALLRLTGRIAFDRSRHNVDNGLFGVLGLMGCCGPKRRRSQRKRYRASDATRSGTFTFTPQFNAVKPSTPRSSTMGPPSVLRPEHVQRPYREDSDDESGYIMGNWQPFPHREYSPVNDQPPQTPTLETAVAPKSGFARVGGGRAHFDSPYAIASGSTQRFPSVERNQDSAPSPVASPARLPSTTTNPSTLSLNHQVGSSLPPGAMTPTRPAVHVRTKSQTAIIEDASALYKVQNLGSSSGAAQETEPLAPPQITVDDDDSSEGTQPRRKHWYNIRRNRRMSEGDEESRPEPTEPSQADNGRSFVVVRDRRPSPLAKPESAKFDIGRSGTETDGDNGRKFVVLRGSSSTEPSGSVTSEAPTRPPPIPRRSSRRYSHT